MGIFMCVYEYELFMSINKRMKMSNPARSRRAISAPYNSAMPAAPPPSAEATRPQDSAVKSADRVLDILELLARQGSALTHHEIGTTLGIPKSSLTHLLRNLVGRGFLALDSTSGVYSLGPAVFRLVNAGHDREGLLARARPIVSWLADTTGEAASFSLFRDDEVERVCVAESRSPLSYRMAVGDRFPLYSTSAGKAILAGLSTTDLAAYLKRVPLRKHTSATVRTAADLRRELDTVRSGGVAYSQGEHTPGVVGIAVGVRPGSDQMPAALNVVVPSVRFTPAIEKACIAALQQARGRFEVTSR
jgi:DNA-binding IclR family transcriptional regulator